MSSERISSGAEGLRAAASRAPAGPAVLGTAESVGSGFRDIAEARRELAFFRAPIPLSLTVLESGLFIDVNEAYCRVAGFTRDELVGRTSTELGIWARPEDRQAIVEDLRRHGRVRDREVSGITHSGRARIALMDADVVEIAGRACLLTSLRDVTEQRQAERAVRSSEEKFARAFQASPDAVTLTRLSDARFIDVNEGFVAMTGYSRAEAVGRSSLDLNLWSDEATREGVLRQVNETGRVRDLERPFRRKDGTLIVCSFSAEVAEIGGERCLIAVTRDLSERKRAEAALRESEERYRLLTERIGQLIYDFDFASHTHSWSGPIERVTGYTPAEFVRVDAEAWRSMIHPDDLAGALAVFQRAAAQRETYRVRYRLRRKNETFATIEESGCFVCDPAGRAVRMLGIIDDVTERERLAVELLQAQKMETVGRLAGGVAHDFNNLLTVILGHLALVQGEGVPAGQAREAIDEAVRAAEMAADLTRQLLTASRQQPLEKRPVDVREVVDGMATLLGRTLGEHIELRVSNASGLPPVLADRGSIEQVLLNLCVNARDAMEQGGVLEIATAAVVLGDDEVRSRPQARVGEFVCISVTDTGCGIAPDLMPRIFEPFFTTKPVGTGTGLGLATVYAILQQHEGWIEAVSVEGEGSAFRAYLPASSERLVEVVRPRPVIPEPVGLGETVLLVEDELAVRRMVETLLATNGYRVATASSGREALDQWDDDPAPFDLLVTDVVMPERVSGPQLAERFRSMGVEAPVIFMSGYRAGALENVQAERGEYFIAKPFRIEDFLDLVRTALAARKRTCVD